MPLPLSTSLCCHPLSVETNVKRASYIYLYVFIQIFICIIWLQSKEAFNFWPFVKSCGILATYKGNYCLPVTLTIQTTSSQHQHFAHWHPLYPVPSLSLSCRFFHQIRGFIMPFELRLSWTLVE